MRRLASFSASRLPNRFGSCIDGARSSLASSRPGTEVSAMTPPSASCSIAPSDSGASTGAPFAIGFVLLIFVHELGHALVLRRQGIPAGAPVFIPFLGAVIAMKGMPRNAWVEALVGIGGPALGTAGAVVCLAMGWLTGAPIWLALASTGFLLNLFNLLPISPLDGGRIGIASQSLGIAEACLNAAVAYAKEHTRGGKPLAKSQAVQQALAEMATRIDAARLLTLRAASLKQNAKPYGREASMAKLEASRSANWCAKEAVQIHGGAGYTRDFPVERYFRDARVTEIYEGTTEIQKLVIARTYLR